MHWRNEALSFATRYITAGSAKSQNFLILFCKESQNGTNIIFCTISATEYVGMYLFVYLLCPMLLSAYDCLPRRKI